MVFSSIPAYLDPANWHQQQSINPQTGSNNNPRSHPLFSTAPAPPPSPPQQPHGGGGAGFIRPGSMTERARLANIPIPEAALQCPRCESTNTKFCYFNNYSLSQPRHFCKTCRRYWTRGGALRNVPVGGGCRRNKRSKGSRSSSKSSAATTLDQSTNSANTSTTIASTGAADILGLGPGVPPLRLMAASQNLTHFPDPDSIGLNFGPVSDQIGGGAGDLSFPIGSSLGTTAGSSIFSGLDQWRLTQQAPRFSFLGGLESSMGIFSMDVGAGPARPEGKVIVGSGAPPAPQVDSVKLEESQELNLSRQFLAMNNNPAGNDQQYWNAGGSSAASLWTELSTFSSSATTNTL